MSRLFKAQNAVLDAKMYTIDIASSTSTQVIISVGGTTIGTYSFNKSDLSKYYWTIELTKEQIFGTGSLTPISVQMTFRQGLTKTQTKSIQINVYSYSIDMDAVDLYTVWLSGKVSNTSGAGIAGATIFGRAAIGEGDTIRATADFQGNYTWTGDLTVGSHTINASADGYLSSMNTIKVTQSILQNTITSNFTLQGTTTVDSCTLVCNNPSKSTTLTITPTTASSETRILGQCTKGVLFRQALTYDNIFKQGVTCRIMDRDTAGVIYSTVTLPANGQIINFTV